MIVQNIIEKNEKSKQGDNISKHLYWQTASNVLGGKSPYLLLYKINLH